MTRCTGHCCERFTINLDALTDPARNVIDGDTIRDMVILLGPSNDQSAPHEYLATCRHYSRPNCGIYSQRPAMCRDFPYGQPCGFAGCTYRPNKSPNPFSLPRP